MNKVNVRAYCMRPILAAGFALAMALTFNACSSGEDNTGDDDDDIVSSSSINNATSSSSGAGSSSSNDASASSSSGAGSSSSNDDGASSSSGDDDGDSSSSISDDGYGTCEELFSAIDECYIQGTSDNPDEFGEYEDCMDSAEDEEGEDLCDEIIDDIMWACLMESSEICGDNDLEECDAHFTAECEDYDPDTVGSIVPKKFANKKLLKR